MSVREPVSIIDFERKTVSLLEEVLTGLSKGQKTIDPKFLYDKKGSEIFEKICLLPEYYPTRAENTILINHAKEMAELIGPHALIVEPGSGSGKKVRAILKELKEPVGYVPIEISRDILFRMTKELHEEFPDLRVLPVCADFNQDLDLPISVDSRPGKKVVYFPGSTIGNLHPKDAIHFLKKCDEVIGTGGGLLIGVDLKKDKTKFQLAYDDPEGVTRDFNLNLLERLNREVGATFIKENFEHVALYNEKLGRVEMHLKSKLPQLIKVDEAVFKFKEGETIHTECSYKYSVDEFCELCAKAGLAIQKFWMDPEKLFCVYYFEKE